MRLLKNILSVFNAAEKRRMLILLVLILGGAVLEAVGTGLIMPFIALISDPTYVDTQPTLRVIYQALGFDTPVRFYIICAFGLLVLFVAKNAYLAVINAVQYRFIYNQLSIFSERLFNAYMNSSYIFHIQNNTALLIRNVSNEALMFFTNVLIPGFILVTESMVILAISTVLLWLSPAPSIVVVLFLAVITSSFYFFVRRKVRSYGILQQVNNGERIKWINQGLCGIKEIKVLGHENYFVDAFTRHDREFTNASCYAMILNQTPRLFIETVAVGALFLIVISVLMAGGDIQKLMPTLALFALASFRLLPSINRIIGSITRIAYYSPAVEVVCRDIHLASLETSKPSSEGLAILPLRKEINLKHVSYTYPGADKPALQDISLSIPRGSSVALLGPSGAGKTTLADIMLGLLVPTSGQVLADGQDIHMSLSAWRNNIGYIPQTIYLSDDTIRHNVAFGVPDNKINDEHVWSALELAQLAEHVRALPQSLETVLGERGVKFSGGQRQRIGIARALYHNPDVLVLDEATSALDAETEMGIADAIESLVGNKTLIIIAHRPSTIEKCRIRYELRNGRIVA